MPSEAAQAKGVTCETLRCAPPELSRVMMLKVVVVASTTEADCRSAEVPLFQIPAEPNKVPEPTLLRIGNGKVRM